MGFDFSDPRRRANACGALVPGGGHTYAKGADQYPAQSPAVLTHGRGATSGMSTGTSSSSTAWACVPCRSATPTRGGRGRAEVLDLGTNFTRPALIELECAERFAALDRQRRDGEVHQGRIDRDTAALKLARAATGRDMVAICAEHPFFSYDDWFIATTTMDGGIPDVEAAMTTCFRYNDLDSVERLFATHPERIAAVFLEPVRTEPPQPGFLEGFASCAPPRRRARVRRDDHRLPLRVAGGPGAVRRRARPVDVRQGDGQRLLALGPVRPPRADAARQSRTGRDDVFLLSTTHGAETTALAAAIATMDVYEREPVIEHLYRQGERLAAGFARRRRRPRRRTTTSHRSGSAATSCSHARPDGQPSQSYRTLFLQETIRRGVLDAVARRQLLPHRRRHRPHARGDRRRARGVREGARRRPERFLVGPPSRHVFDRRFPAAHGQQPPSPPGRHVLDEIMLLEQVGGRRRRRRRRGPNARRCRAGRGCRRRG